MKAELIQHMGTDITVVNAARVSFDKGSSYEFDPINDDWYLKEGDKGLLRYLADHNHWTPFSHAQITLRETVPIFVARQRFKHMVGFTYNEVSRRYVADEPEFHYPTEWRQRAENKKQGSSDERVWSYETDYRGQRLITRPEDEYDELIRQCVKVYNEMIAGGVCPEQARMALPQSMFTSYYVTGSLAAFARAYKLRIDPHSQKEIQDLAKEWDRIIRPLFPWAWAALVD